MMFDREFWQRRQGLKRRRQGLKLTQVAVANDTGLANSSICRFEWGQIPYYSGRSKLDSYYKVLELKEIGKLIRQDFVLAQEIIIERLSRAENKYGVASNLSLARRKNRMRELIELHPREFFETYVGLSGPERLRKAA